MQTLFAVLHVVTAVFVVGPMAVLPMSALRPIRHGHPEHAVAAARSTRLFTVLSVIVAVLGFGLVGLADPRYELSVTTPWVLASIVLYAVAVVVSLAVTVPTLHAMGAGRVSGGPGRVAAASGVVALLLVAVVVLMVWKP